MGNLVTRAFVKAISPFWGSALIVLCLIFWIPERKELFGDSFVFESMLILTAYAFYIGRQYKGRFKIMWAPLIFMYSDHDSSLEFSDLTYVERID